MATIVPASTDAVSVHPRHLAQSGEMFRRMGGQNGEFGWQHPCLPEDETLYVAKLDAIWAGLEALAGHLKRDWNRTSMMRVRRRTVSASCEACGRFSSSRPYGPGANTYQTAAREVRFEWTNHQNECDAIANRDRSEKQARGERLSPDSIRYN